MMEAKVVYPRANVPIDTESSRIQSTCVRRHRDDGQQYHGCYAYYGVTSSISNCQGSISIDYRPHRGCIEN